MSSAPPSSRTWPPATPAAPEGTSTRSPTRASTWPPTGPCWRPTRSASGSRRRSERPTLGHGAGRVARSEEAAWIGSSRPWSFRCRTWTGPRRSTPMPSASTSTWTTAPARTSGSSSSRPAARAVPFRSCATRTRQAPCKGCSWWCGTSTRPGAGSSTVAWTSRRLVHFVDGSPVEGPSPDRADYETFLSFSDPDGNGWMIQEVPSRPS